MTRLSQFFTLDVLSSIAFGEAFGFIACNTDKWPFVAGNETFMPILQLITDVTFVRRFFHNPLVSRLLSPKETDEVGQGRVRRFAAEAIARRFESGKEGRNDMLGSFKEHGLGLEECKSESLIQVIAGTDSTSTVLRMTMLYIASNPLVYRRLQAEVDATDTFEDGVIADAVARQLPYLNAVIWEGLRKTPPLFGLEAKVAPLRERLSMEFSSLLVLRLRPVYTLSRIGRIYLGRTRMSFGRNGGLRRTGRRGRGLRG